ncbi:MAG: PorP/SprF family type IX secretion system membrane protein [Bacteroidota bacterium]|nr:PorP/SprF family type IX secretion system membrane protein [Bacteroidota bacterium]
MIRRLFRIVILVSFLIPLTEKQIWGQEFPWSLQYITNMHTLNPAFVGIWDQAGFMFATRTNWVGITGAPLIQQFSYHTPFIDQTSGVGLNIQRKNFGREKRFYFTGDYSYQVRLNLNHYLRFGLRAGIVNFDNNLSDYQTYPDHIPDPEYTTDVRLYNMSVFGLGAVYFSEDFFMSISVPQIINNTFKVNRNTFSSSKEFQTIYLYGGYVFKLPQSIRLRSDLLIIGTAGKPVYFDASALIYLPVGLQLGISLRNNGEACFSCQYTMQNKLKIGYAADYVLSSDIRKYQLGTHEIVIGYDINLSKSKIVVLHNF